MAQNSGILVPSAVRPVDSQDTYPVAYSNEIKGGPFFVNTTQDRDAIPTARKTEGCECYVAEDKGYRWVGGVWVALSFEPANANIQAHVASAHAPSNAQKNSDITKAEIEAKLTGELTSHSHAPNHTHTNKTTLDKITESAGAPLWDGGAWPGGGAGGHNIQEAGVSQTARANLNFAAPFAVDDDAGNDRTTISVPEATSSTSGLMSAGAILGLGGWLNITKAGVLNNGTDQSATIQALIDALPSGYTLYFPNGIYGLNTGLVLPDDKAITLLGEGYKSIFKALSRMTNLVYQQLNNSYWVVGSEIKDIAFNGNFLADNTLRLEHWNRSKLSHVVVYDFLVCGLDVGVDSGTSAEFYEAEISNISVRSNELVAANRPIHGIRLRTYSSDSVINNAVIENVKTCVYEDTAGNNQYSQIHMYGYPEEFSPEIGIHIKYGNTTISQIYADGCVIGAKIEGGNVKIDGIIHKPAAYIMAAKGFEISGDLEEVRVDCFFSNITTNYSVLGSGILGAGCAINSRFSELVSSRNISSGSGAAASITLTLNHTSDPAAGISAQNNTISYKGSDSGSMNSSDIRGLTNAAYNNSTSNSKWMLATVATGGCLSSGNITGELRAYDAQCYNPGAGRVTKYVGFKLSDNSYFQDKCDEVYGVYVEGNYPSYFGGGIEFADGTSQNTAAVGLQLTKVTSGTIYIEPTDSIIEVTTNGAIVNVGAVNKQAVIVSNTSSGNITLQTSGVSPFPTLVGSPITLAAGSFVVIGEDPSNTNTNRVVLTGSNSGTPDLSGYALLAGRSSGQILVGGTDAADDLVLQGTSGNATSTGQGNIVFKTGNNGGTTAGTIDYNGWWGLGVTPTNLMHIKADSAVPCRVERSSSSATAGVVTIYNPNTTDNAGALLSFLTQSTGAGATEIVGGDIGCQFVTHDHATRKADIVFRTQNAGLLEALRIQSNRNLRVSNNTIPATTTSTGTAGEIAVDVTNGYLYLCIATNTWRRVQINGTW